jgi:type IV pilus assembly protein PilW
MVSLAIGMIAIIVVMQVFSLSEGTKRATTSGNDAQTTAAIALATLQRDIRQAGHGISQMNLMGCDLTLSASKSLPLMSPLTINHGSFPAGDDNTDTLAVVFGNNRGSPEGDPVLAQPGAAIYTVATPETFAVGDRVIGRPETLSPCDLTLASVTAISTTDATATVGTGQTGMTNGTLFNVGSDFQVRVYAIRNGTLTVCDHGPATTTDCTASDADSLTDPAIWVPIGHGIVSLRAEYGQDTTAPMDAVVDAYNQTTPSDACGWARVSAVRLAVVARSDQMEREDVTDDADPPASGAARAPRWSGQASTPIDLTDTGSGADFNWQRYRYKTFETTAPMRNMAWQGVQAGC